MDFARKQLEKFGWKEGNGLGKNNQGMVQAIKPSLKTGKEGMGYDFSKELVDTWWTRAYDDSLNRINIETDKESSETVGVTLKDDDDDDKGKGNGLVQTTDAVERPFEKMRKRMMKATFTNFSKGATLSNGEMLTETKSDSESEDSEDEAKKNTKDLKALTDEQLFKACGGRTAHKAARFGLKLNGKLARIAAQEEAAKALLLSNSPKNSKSIETTTKSSQLIPFGQPYKNQKPVVSTDSADNLKKKKKKSKKKSKDDSDDINENQIVEDNSTTTTTSNTDPLPPVLSENQENNEEDNPDSKKKRKKHKKRKYTELEAPEEDTNQTPEIPENPDPVDDPEGNSTSSKDKKSLKKKHKKSKKLKLGRSSDKNDEDETQALLSE